MAASTLTAAIGMAQHSMDTDIEANESNHHFNTLQELSHQITSDALARKANLFSEEVTQERKLSSALRRQALEIARRECLRDTWVAHSGNVQASLFIATVLIGFGYEILSGAIVSENWLKYHRAVVSIFFVLTLASIGLGLVALSLLIVRYQRLAKFDFETPWKSYSCGHNHVEMVSYIECRCRWLEKWANFCLILSACSGLAALMFYSVDKFQNLPVMENIVHGKMNFYSAAKSVLFSNNTNETTTTTTTIKRVVSPDPIRDYAAPAVFCVIVGATMIVMLVLEFVYLSSDTLKRRPDDVAVVLGEEEDDEVVNNNNSNDKTGEGGNEDEEMKLRDKFGLSSDEGNNIVINTAENEENDEDDEEQQEEPPSQQHQTYILHSPNSDVDAKGELPEDMSPENFDQEDEIISDNNSVDESRKTPKNNIYNNRSSSVAGLNDDSSSVLFDGSNRHLPVSRGINDDDDDEELQLQNNEGRYSYEFSASRRRERNNNNDNADNISPHQQNPVDINFSTNHQQQSRLSLPRRRHGKAEAKHAKMFTADF